MEPEKKQERSGERGDDSRGRHDRHRGKRQRGPPPPPPSTDGNDNEIRLLLSVYRLLVLFK